MKEEFLKYKAECRAVRHTVTLHSHIKDEIGSNFGRDISFPESFVGFPQAFQADTWIIPLVYHDSFLLSLSQFVVYLSHHLTPCCLGTGSVVKQTKEGENVKP
jgi:hypothetical protein